MSVLSSFPVMPNRIAIACEYLNFLGPDGGRRDAIEKQLSPLRGENEEGETGSTIATSIINEMEKLKLLTTSEGNVKLAEEICNLAPSSGDWQVALRSILSERMTSPELADSYGQSELPDALSWLLSQNPLDPLPRMGGQHVQRISRQLGEADSLRTSIGNDSRYQNLLYWGRYFGFAEWLNLNSINVVIPDPSEAIVRHLIHIFDAKENELPFNTFLQRLGEACPVMDTGRARVKLEERLDTAYRLKMRHLSRSTSLALKRLELRGIVSMTNPSDAELWVLDLADDMPEVSYIKLLQRPSI